MSLGASRCLALSVHTSTIACYTVNMELYQPQSSLKPGQQSQNTRSTVADAGKLMLKLQALDEKLRLTPPENHHNIDLDSIVVKSGVYVNGSEHLYQLVKMTSRPDLIPEVYFEAYITLLQRRPYVNHDRVSDVNKGNDPTFSEIWRILSKIDALCGTGLRGYIQKLDQAGKYCVQRLIASLSSLRPNSEAFSLPAATC